MCCAGTSSLQRHPDAPRVGQRLTADEVCPGGRSHSAAADPRRITPSLHPDLIATATGDHARQVPLRVSVRPGPPRVIGRSRRKSYATRTIATYARLLL